MGGLESLGIDLPRLIAQLLTFGILFGLLFFLAYKPFMRMLDERSQKTRESVELAEEAKKIQSQAEEEFKKRLAQASEEARKVIEDALKAGEEVKEKARAEARAEAEAIISKAREEIKMERDEAIEELRQEFSNLVIQAAEKVIERSLDKKTHEELIEQIFNEALLGKG